MAFTITNSQQKELHRLDPEKRKEVIQGMRDKYDKQMDKSNDGKMQYTAKKDKKSMGY